MDPQLIHPEPGPSESPTQYTQPLYDFPAQLHHGDQPVFLTGVAPAEVMPANVVAKPKAKQKKPERETGKTLLPATRVQKILKADKEMSTCGKDAVFLISVAAEEFIKRLAQAGHQQAQRDKRSIVQQRDLAAAVRTSQHEELAFLEEVIPPAITLSQALELARRIDPDDPFADPPFPATPIKPPTVRKKDREKAKRESNPKTATPNGAEEERGHGSTNDGRLRHLPVNGLPRASRSREQGPQRVQQPPLPHHMSQHHAHQPHHHHHYHHPSHHHSHPSHRQASHSPVSLHPPNLPNGASYGFVPHESPNANHHYHHNPPPDHHYHSHSPEDQHRHHHQLYSRDPPHIMNYANSGPPPPSHVAEFTLSQRPSSQNVQPGPPNGYGYWYGSGPPDEYREPRGREYPEPMEGQYVDGDGYTYGQRQGPDPYGREEYRGHEYHHDGAMQAEHN